jgi:5-methylthioribose kinase
MAEQPIPYLNDFWKHYPASGINFSLVRQFEGMELIRRMIGLAQLPLYLHLKQREKLLEEGRYLLMDG